MAEQGRELELASSRHMASKIAAEALWDRQEPMQTWKDISFTCTHASSGYDGLRRKVPCQRLNLAYRQDRGSKLVLVKACVRQLTARPASRDMDSTRLGRARAKQLWRAPGRDPRSLRIWCYSLRPYSTPSVARNRNRRSRTARLAWHKTRMQWQLLLLIDN